MFFVFNLQPVSQAECRRSDPVCERQALDVHGVELQTEDPQAGAVPAALCRQMLKKPSCCPLQVAPEVSPPFSLYEAGTIHPQGSARTLSSSGRALPL